ncbi:hypothetical protein BJ322DRAFT_1071186 [Thelephora terrestris]|uniref:Uncharacterized protein n=1 Tax=Thelephora terrestris TaxID=56493 RepID=A0A9P6HBE1_9AGAM|nr:hypothetical protein BJ322DRAFT_1071186 [Thelephora terrestris]
MGPCWPKFRLPYLKATHPWQIVCVRVTFSMTDPIPPFEDPELLCLSVPALRRYWAHLLQDCIEKHAQEHPLYALFSSILSTLSKSISVPGCQVSPMGVDGSIVFSYPQCRLVDKNAVGDSDDESMSIYPDFGLLHLMTEQSPNGKTKVERVKLLIEVKRLYVPGKGCLWADEANRPAALQKSIKRTIRQLLLQAYSTFSVYNQPDVFIMLITGAYFTLFKFVRPDFFEPLPQAPEASNKKRKLEAEEAITGKSRSRPAREIGDYQLIDLVPLENLEVVYHDAPVFEDIEASDLGLHLSDAFRQALRERLDDVAFQPCSLFNLHTAQYTPTNVRMMSVKDTISQWYSRARGQGPPKTPKRPLNPYFDSPIDGEETFLSPEYRGRVRASGVGHRESLPRKSKDVTNSLRDLNVFGGGEDLGKWGLGAVGDAGGAYEELCEDSDGEGESELISLQG